MIKVDNFRALRRYVPHFYPTIILGVAVGTGIFQTISMTYFDQAIAGAAIASGLATLVAVGISGIIVMRVAHGFFNSYLCEIRNTLLPLSTSFAVEVKILRKNRYRVRRELVWAISTIAYLFSKTFGFIEVMCVVGFSLALTWIIHTVFIIGVDGVGMLSTMLFIAGVGLGLFGGAMAVAALLGLKMIVPICVRLISERAWAYSMSGQLITASVGYSQPIHAFDTLVQKLKLRYALNVGGQIGRFQVNPTAPNDFDSEEQVVA